MGVNSRPKGPRPKPPPAPPAAKEQLTDRYYRIKADTAEVIVTDKDGIETRRYSHAEMMAHSPESNGVLQGLMQVGVVTKAREVERLLCINCDRIDIYNGEYLKPRQFTTCAKCLAKPKKQKTAIDEGLDWGRPEPKTIKDTLTGDIYYLITAYPDGWVIGRCNKGHEYAMPPRCWEDYHGIMPTPRPSSGETIMR